jgi:hypothetical protein
MKRLVLVGLVVVGLLGFGGAPVPAATSTGGRAGRQAWASRIVSPSENAVVLGRSVRVVVQVGPGVRSFKASVGSRVITKSFRSANRGTERVATLRYGRTGGPRFGHNTVHVMTGNGRGRRWFTQVRFVLARAVGGLLQGVGAEPGCGTGSRISIELARPGLHLSVWVNGGRRLVVSGGRERSTILTADSGLRPGKNRIKVQALDPRGGGYTQRRLTVTMPGQTPVAGAGPAKRAKTGRVVRFNAGASVSAVKGQRLRYRWTIVKRPAGSRARLRDASGVRPSLRPDRPGRYVLQVTVTPALSHPGARGARNARLLCSSNGASARTTLLAAVAAPPTGVAIDTFARRGDASGVQVGSQFYAAPDPKLAVQLLVLDRSTLAMVNNQSFGDDASGASGLLSTVKPLSNSDLVIISKPNLDNGGNAASAATINQALQAIGVSAVPASVATTGASCNSTVNQCSAFSAIGVPGIPVGQGTVDPGFGGLPAGALNGRLQGYLRENLAGSGYTFVNTERVPLDTGDPGANPAVVTVGSNETGSEAPKRTYTSTKLSGPGFYVLVLDSGSLAVDQQGTFANTASGLQAMAKLLENAIADPAGLVIVRSIGAVGRVSSGGGAQTWWDLVAGSLQDLGGSTYYFDALDGKSSSQYAQVSPVGWPGYPGQWTQVASQEASSGGRLSGLLARNSSSQLALQDAYPTGLQDPGRPLAGSLPGLMSLPMTDWPDRGSQGDQSVLDCIAAHINPLGPLNTPIESNYTNQNLIGNWTGWASTISNPDYFQTLSGDDNCRPFTRSDFNDVTGQLAQEWTAVPAVWQLIANMKSPLLDSQGNAAEIGSIVSAINTDVGTGSSPQKAHYNGYAIAGDVLAIAENVAGAIPDGAVITVPLQVIGGGLTLAQALDQKSDGSNAVATVTVSGADLAATLARRYTTEINAFSQVGEILVSNWTYLRVAGQNATDTKNAVADWSWTAKQGADGAQLLLLATRRQTYEALFPVRYQLYRLQGGTGSFPANTADWTCDRIKQTQGITIGYTVVSSKPFSNVSAQGSFTPTVSVQGTQEHWVYSASDNWYGGAIDADTKAVLPAPGLVDQMFSDPQTDAGLSTPLFNPLQFDLEAYPGASPGQPVAHVKSAATPPSTTATQNYCNPQ